MPPRPDSLTILLRRSRRQAWLGRAADAGLPAVLAAGSAAAVCGAAGVTAALPTLAAFWVVWAIAAGRPPTLAETAARLDRTYETADLFTSALRTQAADAWASAVRASAVARAAAVRPTRVPRRVSLRQHACVTAAMVVLVLLARLPAKDRDRLDSTAISDRPADTAPGLIAASPVPRADTAESDAPAPPSAATTDAGPASARRPAKPNGIDAHGTGRADAGPGRSPPGVRFDTESEPAVASASGQPGGPGPAALAGGDHSAAPGVVTAGRPAAAPADRKADQRSGPADASGSAAAPDAPAYRDLVRDFFSR